MGGERGLEPFLVPAPPVLGPPPPQADSTGAMAAAPVTATAVLRRLLRFMVMSGLLSPVECGSGARPCGRGRSEPGVSKRFDDGPGQRRGGSGARSGHRAA